MQIHLSQALRKYKKENELDPLEFMQLTQTTIQKLKMKPEFLNRNLNEGWKLSRYSNYFRAGGTRIQKCQFKSFFCKINVCKFTFLKHCWFEILEASFISN